MGSTVPWIATGTSWHNSTKARSMPSRPALTFKVSWLVSRSNKSTPPSIRPAAWIWYPSASSSKVIPPVTEMVLVVGPIDPATNRGFPGVDMSSAVRRARLAASRLRRRASWARSYSANTTGVEPNVFVSIMSAPASR